MFSKELPNDLRFQVLRDKGNIGRISKLDGDTSYSSVSPL